MEKQLWREKRNGTIGANERATAGTDKFSGFEDSLKEGS